MGMHGIPFDEDVMTLFMGLGDPMEPGQHGRTIAPAPSKDAISLVTQIKDLCEEFLLSCKECDDKGKDEGKGDGEPDVVEVEKKTIAKADAGKPDAAKPDEEE